MHHFGEQIAGQTSFRLEDWAGPGWLFKGRFAIAQQKQYKHFTTGLEIQTMCQGP